MSLNHTFGGGAMASLTVLPNGNTYVNTVSYSKDVSVAVLILAIISMISLLSALGLLFAIGASAFNARTAATGENVFFRTHVAAYFGCLLLCDTMQGIGSIMNIKWFLAMGVESGQFCIIQGTIKQISDVGTAVWSLIIAFHTFSVLFFQLEMRRVALFGTLVGGWTAVTATVIAGPVLLNTAERGSFWGISGYWCWISDSYRAPQVTCDYIVMFLAASVSFILYALLFLKLYGFIGVDGWRCYWITACNGGSGHPNRNSHSQVIARRMLWYPLAYSILLLPIAACRFASWTGHHVPFEVMILADSIFLLSGLVNTVLFVTTRRMLPIPSVLTRLSSLSRTRGRASVEDSEKGTISDDGGDEKQRSSGSPMYDIPLAPASAIPAWMRQASNPTAIHGTPPCLPAFRFPGPLASASMPTAQFVGSTPFLDPEAETQPRHLPNHWRQNSFGAGAWSPSREQGPTREEFAEGWTGAGLPRTQSLEIHIDALYRTGTRESRRPSVRDIECGKWDGERR